MAVSKLKGDGHAAPVGTSQQQFPVAGDSLAMNSFPCTAAAPEQDEFIAQKLAQGVAIAAAGHGLAISDPSELKKLYFCSVCGKSAHCFYCGLSSSRDASRSPPEIP